MFRVPAGLGGLGCDGMGWVVRGRAELGDRDGRGQDQADLTFRIGFPLWKPGSGFSGVMIFRFGKLCVNVTDPVYLRGKFPVLRTGS